MKKRQRRAAEALVNGEQTIDQIADAASISKRTLAKWVQEPKQRAYLRAEVELADFWLRQRTRYLMSRAVTRLGKMLRSPNLHWGQRRRVIDTVLRQRTVYPDLVVEIVPNRRFGKSRVRVVEFKELRPELRRALQAALADPPNHGPRAP